MIEGGGPIGGGGGKGKEPNENVVLRGGGAGNPPCENAALILGGGGKFAISKEGGGAKLTGVAGEVAPIL